MESLIRLVLARPRSVVAIWVLMLALAAGFALRLPDVVRGSTGNIEHSESGRVAERLQQRFGPGSAYLFPVVVQSRQLPTGDPRFAAQVEAIARALRSVPGSVATDHYWNTGAAELLGRDGRSALILVRPGTTSFFEVENLTAALRQAVARVPTAPGITVMVTGVPALFHDLNRNSSADLSRAERIGVPLTLLILLFVFGAPLAAVLPLLVAAIAVTLASAGLYLLSDTIVVSVLAQNVVGMVGLGVGVDYALFLLCRFRRELGRGDAVREAVLRASVAAGHAVLVSGIAVAIGFIGLLLVNASFIHNIALGGLLVVAVAVLAAISLLPVLLLWFGHRVNWPRANTAFHPGDDADSGPWARWVAAIMRRPWHFLVPALVMTGALAAPALHMRASNASVNDLAPQVEARRGFEALQRNFEPGWMGPVALLIESAPGRSLGSADAQQALRALAAGLKSDPRVALVQVDARQGVSTDGTAALLVVVTRHAPDSAEALRFVDGLRASRWPEAAQAGLSVRIGGPTAMIADFDAELFGSLWHVIPAVLAGTFVVLMLALRSLVLPLKAMALNLLSVTAAYGFLVLVFQDGIGASVLGIDAPGGLTSLVVLMLFTILFGISMDYEVFLLHQIREEYLRTGDNRRAVACGVARSASPITSAAAIMFVLFGSFGFTQFTATREFGLGLAFAVALDATLIRLLIAPALMELLGAANWWWPASRQDGFQPAAAARRAGRPCPALPEALP